MISLHRTASRGASATILSIGMTLLGVSASVLAIDLPTYFNARNELQTALDAAALAGAAQLPSGQPQAEAAALSVAGENPVAGIQLTSDNLNFKNTSSKFTVTGQVKVPTIVGKFLCAMSGGNSGSYQMNQSNGGYGSSGTSQSSCDSMQVVAGSSAAPAARDTILVIDSSSSMDDLGNGRPLKDVKSAAVSYVDTVAALQNESVDRIGLITFNQTGLKQIGLTSQSQSAGFATVKSKINGITLFSGTGWNTNYQAGLTKALDELEANGRPNAQKNIIFMTDGMPNLPAPASYYSYNSSEPYRKCTDSVNNSTVVKNLCVKKNGQTVCPTLPNTAITTSMISAKDYQCGVDYVNAMQSLTNAQTDRAKQLKVTINTLVIHDTTGDDNATEVLRRLIKNETWEPNQIDYMASTTKGHQYDAANYDAAKIKQIYQDIAQDIHIRLTQ